MIFKSYISCCGSKVIATFSYLNGFQASGSVWRWNGTDWRSVQIKTPLGFLRKVLTLRKNVAYSSVGLVLFS